MFSVERYDSPLTIPNATKTGFSMQLKTYKGKDITPSE